MPLLRTKQVSLQKIMNKTERKRLVIKVTINKINRYIMKNNLDMDKGASLIWANPMVLEFINIKMSWTSASRSSFLQVPRIKARYSTSLLSSLKLLRMLIPMECRHRVVYRGQSMGLLLIPGICIPSYMMMVGEVLHQEILKLIKAIAAEDKKMWSYAKIPPRHLCLSLHREAET